MATEQLAQRNVLVVDDEPVVCETVSMLLQMDGHKVGTAQSGKEALSVFEPGKFHLVITDFFMPGMTGAELAMAIKRRAPAQPVVLLTAYAERFRTSEGALEGIDFVLEKPIPVGSLKETVDRFAPGKAQE